MCGGLSYINLSKAGGQRLLVVMKHIPQTCFAGPHPLHSCVSQRWDIIFQTYKDGSKQGSNFHHILVIDKISGVFFGGEGGGEFSDGLFSL